MYNRNILTSRLQIIKGEKRRLQNAKFFTLLAVLELLIGALCIYPAISSLMNSIIIGSTGRIATLTTSITYKSEIRGVFVHCATFAYPVDWNVIAETLKQYKIDAVFGEFLGFAGGYYGGSPSEDQLAQAIAACHARGIEVHAAMTFFYHSWPSNEYKAIDSAGNIVPYWICPTKQIVRNAIKAQVEEVARNYDIDGFMFDYIRYDDIDMCYCSECKAKFQQWLGEGTITDWTPFYPGGSRHNKYLEWRTIPITELVRDVRNWMLAIKPNLKFSVAAWTLFGDAPTYWRMWIGQDTADWVANDYLDMVAPMMYTDNPADIQNYIQNDFKYMVGGPEGKVPLLAFVTTGVDEPISVSAFKAVIDKARQMGADGWIIWRYGGPGVESGGYLIDITPYLNALTLPDTFSLKNIQVSVGATETTISWITDLPATSKVEYSLSPLFNASFIYDEMVDFNYWDIDHVVGTILQNNTLTTEHRVTIINLSPGTKYYFRVQSQGDSGIATGQVMTFTTSS